MPWKHSRRGKEVQQATPGTLFWILTNGVVRRGMPVWSKLPEPQRWQIVTYLKSLGIREKEKAHDEEVKPVQDEHIQPRMQAAGAVRSHDKAYSPSCTLLRGSSKHRMGRWTTPLWYPNAVAVMAIGGSDDAHGGVTQVRAQ
jgi:hypothetical protein